MPEDIVERAEDAILAAYEAGEMDAAGTIEDLIELVSRLRSALKEREEALKDNSSAQLVERLRELAEHFREHPLARIMHREDALFQAADLIEALTRVQPSTGLDMGAQHGMVPYGPEHPDYPNEPSDWDGGPYLCRDGGFYDMRGYGWEHGLGCWNDTAAWDRIAYRQKGDSTK